MPNMSGSHYAHVVVLRICRFVHLSINVFVECRIVDCCLSFVACRMLSCRMSAYDMSPGV